MRDRPAIAPLFSADAQACLQLADPPTEFVDRIATLARGRLGVISAEVLLVAHACVYDRGGLDSNPRPLSGHPFGDLLSSLLSGKSNIVSGELANGRHTAVVAIQLPEGDRIGALCVSSHHEFQTSIEAQADLIWLSTLIAAAYQLRLEAERIGDRGASLVAALDDATEKTKEFRTRLLRSENDLAA